MWLKILIVALLLGPLLTLTEAAVFNVRDYGATGKKADDARPAIQNAIEACAAVRGGTVLLPSGEYTSGTLRLRSHVRIEIASGATLFASTNPAAFEFGMIAAQAALFFGEDLEEVTIEGTGTVDGQAEYEWREDNFERGFSHKESMQKLGKPLMRSFPKGFPQRQVFPRLVWLGRSKDVKFTGLKWLHSPSWTINLYACERARFEDLYIHTSLKDGSGPTASIWTDAKTFPFRTAQSRPGMTASFSFPRTCGARHARARTSPSLIAGCPRRRLESNSVRAIGRASAMCA